MTTHASKDIILVVDDEAPIRTMIGRILDRSGFVHYESSDPNTALGLADLYNFSLVLCDINMPGGSGLQMLRDLRMRHPDIAVVIVTGFGDKANAQTAAQFGATGFVAKPFETSDLLSAVDQALERRKKEIESRSVRR
jgi:DNA-binding NtrC family response regulator